MLSKFNEPLTNEEIVSIRDNHAGKLENVSTLVLDMQTYPDKFKWDYKEAGTPIDELDAKYQEELASHTSKKDRLQQIVDKANSLL